MACKCLLRGAWPVRSCVISAVTALGSDLTILKYLSDGRDTLIHVIFWYPGDFSHFFLQRGIREDLFDAVPRRYAATFLGGNQAAL